jgi:hypothetical protein
MALMEDGNLEFAAGRSHLCVESKQFNFGNRKAHFRGGPSFWFSRDVSRPREPAQSYA